MKFILILSILFSLSVFAEDDILVKRYSFNGETFEYKTPSNFQFITTLPHNAGSFLKNSFTGTEANLKAWAAIILSSALLIHYDQEVTDNVQKLGRKLGIGNDENTKATLRIGGSAMLRAPSDVGSFIYFLGDGWITLGLASGFLTNGYVTKDQRAQNVAQELLQGALLTGLTTQILKRSTGRESPIKSSAPGGKWRFFPSFKTFQGNISKYDAFPSGHLAMTMTTFMIISENYAEYHWIKPVGYTVISLLSFQMVNNSVHWAGDYPLALGIGYVIGKTIVDSARTKVDDPNASKVSFAPLISPDGKLGLQSSLSF